ncbi:hypothetical protein EYM_03200 [Ignicoccus islandicus DSM 13165]|uniref:AAA+ ATPase domain-containing protein n=1 Tax=Ignicoccus islandicus DSM 13165 TaxID=940295 RepID=A0A0U3DY30_9CREN|nr:ATP-binding protein [Ignicoccus islandicus]ALU12394.1 hypothetical protein EYM_03200 [Ignicoccus islandicus DSM 13165]
MEISVNEVIEMILKFMRSYQKTGETPGILLLGAPGIGKSEAIVESARIMANEMGLHFWIYESRKEPEKPLSETFTLVALRLDMIKPEDLTGIPQIHGDEEVFDYKLPRWVKVLRESAGGMLFLDEFTNVADDTLMSAAFEILLNKSVNMYKFNKLVVAAGNPPEYSTLARPLPLPLLSGRLAVFYVRAPKLEEWLDYMQEKYGENWAPEVYSFLVQHPNLFLSVPSEGEGLEPFPTPRAWSKLAIELQTSWRDEIDKLREESPVESSAHARSKKVGIAGKLTALASAFVGKEAGTLFVAWLRVKPPSLEDVLKSPELIKELNEEQKYMLITQLVNSLNRPKWKDRTYYVINAFNKVNEVKYAVMALRLLPKKKRSEFMSYLKDRDKKLWNKLNFELRLARVWH